MRVNQRVPLRMEGVNELNNDHFNAKLSEFRKQFEGLH